MSPCLAFITVLSWIIVRQGTTGVAANPTDSPAYEQIWGAIHSMYVMDETYPVDGYYISMPMVEQAAAIIHQVRMQLADVPSMDHLSSGRFGAPGYSHEKMNSIGWVVVNDMSYVYPNKNPTVTVNAPAGYVDAEWETVITDVLTAPNTNDIADTEIDRTIDITMPLSRNLDFQVHMKLYETSDFIVAYDWSKWTCGDFEVHNFVTVNENEVGLFVAVCITNCPAADDPKAIDKLMDLYKPGKHEFGNACSLANNGNFARFPKYEFRLGSTQSVKIGSLSSSESKNCGAFQHSTTNLTVNVHLKDFVAKLYPTRFIPFITPSASEVNTAQQLVTDAGSATDAWHIYTFTYGNEFKRQIVRFIAPNQPKFALGPR